MDLSVIIVSWNVQEELKNNLVALFKSQGDFSYEVLVVDNNSQDESVKIVKSNFPQVKLTVNSTNLGFARANNQAIKLAQGRFILLLNPDMQVRGDTLKEVLTWAQQNPQATVIGCKLIDEQQKIIKQVRRFPKFFDQLMVSLKVPHFFPGIINRYLCSGFNYDEAAPVDSLRGSFFLINKENYQRISQQALPLLDERYFIWFEEVDFCRQIYKLNGQVWYTPVTECFDYIGQSFKQVKRGQAQRYFGDSMLKYFQKWEKQWQYLILKVIWGIINLIV